MQVDIRFRRLDRSEALRLHTTRRIHLLLGRFGRELTSVVAQFGDVNASRGGADMRCKITATGPRVGTVALDETHEDAYAAAELALERVARTVGRRIEKSRDLSRRPAAPQGSARGETSDDA
jgi:ribosome-associated translation inhibitor RaiA